MYAYESLYIYIRRFRGQYIGHSRVTSILRRANHQSRRRGQRNLNTRTTMSIASRIIAFEMGELDDEQVIELFENLRDSGILWQLQGAYQRMAADLGVIWPGGAGGSIPPALCPFRGKISSSQFRGTISGLENVNFGVKFCTIDFGVLISGWNFGVKFSENKKPHFGVKFCNSNFGVKFYDLLFLRSNIVWESVFYILLVLFFGLG